MSGITAADKASFSQLSTLAQCEAKFQYRYTTDLSDTKGPALQLGSLVGNGCRQMWETCELWTSLDIAVRPGDPPPDPPDPEVLSTAEWLLDRYWVHYRRDIERFGGRVQSELHLEATLPNGITLQGYFDHLLVGAGMPTLVERKTMNNWSRMDSLVVDPQITLYFWLARENGIEVGSVLFDAIKTYRWALEKPTQKELLENNPTLCATMTKTEQRDWARAEVARHPGVETHPPADSFQQAWLFRDEYQVEQALAWAMAGLDRRTQLLIPDAVPIRNLGPLCNGCGYRPRCYDDLAFPAEGDIEVLP